MVIVTQAIVKLAALSPVAPEPRRRCSSYPTLVGTHKLSFGQDVTIHRAQQFLLGRAGFQYQIDGDCLDRSSFRKVGKPPSHSTP
jgi:hypothetical protein